MVKGATIVSKMVKKEMKMIDYGMFSEAGEKAIAGIVKFAQDHYLDWAGVEGMLEQLSQKPGFEEATDTVVRENVYITMGF